MPDCATPSLGFPPLEWCSTPLWNSSLTWDNTTQPDFTPCFHRTVLSGLPLALAALVVAPRAVWLRCRAGVDPHGAPRLPSTFRSGLRAGCMALMAIISLVQLGFEVRPESPNGTCPDVNAWGLIIISCWQSYALLCPTDL